MRLAARWLDELLDDAFALPLAPHRGRTLDRVWADVSLRQGLLFGAPLVKRRERLLHASGGLSPLVRFLLVVVDAARMAAAHTGRDDGAARRDLLLALALLIDDERLAKVFADPLAKQKARDDASVALGAALRRRRMLFGNPIVGLTLIYGLTALDAMTVVELLDLRARGVEPAELTRVARRTTSARVLFVGEVAALTRARPGLELAVEVADWQVKNLGLAKREATLLRDALDDDWPREDALREVDRAMQLRVLHAVVLVAHIDGILEAHEHAHLEEMRRLYGLERAALARIERRVTHFLEEHRDAFNPLEKAHGFDIDGAPVSVKLARAIRTGGASVFAEIKETGDLAVLLAKKAARQELSDDESARMWEQLKDVARVVPSLAVFTLPGGAFLLPLLYRVLPFDLRPSSFRPGRFRAFGDDEATISTGGAAARPRGRDVEDEAQRSGDEDDADDA